MLSRAGLVLIYALVLHCFLLASPTSALIVDAKYDLADVDVSYLPVYPPVYNTGAVMTVTADQAIYFRAGRCKLNAICNGTNIVPCCSPSDCDPVLLQRKPTAPTDCACPTVHGSACVDAFTPFMVGAGDAYQQVGPLATYAFEIAFNQSCNNMIIDAAAIRGYWSLNTGPADRTPDRINNGGAFHVSNALGTNQIVLCAGATDGQAGLYSSGINSLNAYSTSLASDRWPRVRGVVQGSGTLNLTVTEVLDPNGLVPLVDPTGVHLWWTIGMINGTCSSSGKIPFAKQVPPFLPVFLPPTVDPLYDWAQQNGILAPVSTAALNPRQISFFIPLATDVLFSANPVLPDIDTCTFDFSEYRTADDEAISNLTITFRKENTTTCDRTALAQLDAAHQQRLANFKSDHSVVVSAAKIWAAAGMTSSLLWSACKRFADQYVLTNDYVVSNTTLCLSGPGTDDFYNDPCCNQELSWLESCEASTVVASNFGGNDLLVAEQCASPACSAEIASSLAAVNSRIASSTCSAEAVRSLVQVLDPINDAFGLVKGACADVFASGTDTELLDCLGKDGVISNAYRQEFYALWGINEAQANASTFRALLVAQYNKSGCYQPGITTYDTTNRVTIRNDSLDSNLAACSATQACNWGTDVTTNASCVASPQGDKMCASCSDGYCEPLSTAATCTITSLPSRMYSLEDYCNLEVGGTYVPEVGCVSPPALPGNNLVSYLFCVEQTLCPSADECGQSYCYFNELANANDCDCTANNPSPPAVCGLVGRLVFLPNPYSSSLDRCFLPAAGVTYELCMSLPSGPSLLVPTKWTPDELNSETDCQIYGGKCELNNALLGTFLNETDCLSAAGTDFGDCSVPCAGCNQTACEATIGCNDQVLNPALDVASTIRDYDAYGNNFVTCANGATDVANLGCVWNYDTTGVPAATVKAILGGTLVPKPGYTNRSQCESAGRCVEPSFGPGVSTPKNSTQCAEAGGTFTNAFQWDLGVWTPKSLPFIPGTWVDRQFTTGVFRPATFFNRSGFAEDFYIIQGNQQARTADQTALCKNAQQFDLVTALACDCASGAQPKTCFSTPPLQLELLQRACANLPNDFEFSGNQGSISVNANSAFSPPCVDLLISAVPYAPFRLTTTTVYTSVFLQTLSPGPFAVLENSRMIATGTLYGNGIRVSVGEGTLNGSYSVCLAIDSDIHIGHRFKVPDFATIDVDLDANSFRPLMFTDCMLTNEFVCCPNVPSQGSSYLFPVMRVRDPAGERTSDTMTKNQRNCFLAAIVIYIIVWVLISFRFLNYIFYIILRPVAFPFINLLLLGLVLTFLFAALALRWTYFLVTYRGELSGAPQVGELIYGELPFYFFLTIFTVIVAWWIELHYWAQTARNRFLVQMRWVLIAFNVFLYAFFIAVIITFAATSRKTAQTFGVCSARTRKSDRSARILAKVYKTTISAIAAALAIGFLVYGSRIISVITSGMNVNRRAVVSFTLIAVTCAVALLMECGVLLYTTWTGHVNTVAALVVLIVSEIVPALVMAIAMRQPKLQKHPVKDVFWCFFEPDPQASTSATNSRFSRSDQKSEKANPNSSRF